MNQSRVFLYSSQETSISFWEEAEAKVEDILKGFKVDIMSCNLFPPKYDFKTVCSCEECLPKIKYLKDFEGFLLSSYKVVLNLMIRRDQAIEHCDTLITACDWSACTLDNFLNSLKEVYDELGEEFTEGGKSLKHKIETMKLFKSIAQSGLFHNYEVPTAYFEDRTTDPAAKDIDFDIGSRGMYYYKRTKFGEEVRKLLNQILQIEAEHVKAKKDAADNGKRLNPSISMDFIHHQIECLENLPVEGLRAEAEACIEKVSNITLIQCYVSDAKRSIDGTCMDMVDVRKAFWRKYKKKHEGKVGHKLTGLSTTLDLLKEKAEAFYAEWKKWENHFAPCFPPLTPQPRDKPMQQCSN